VVTNKDGLAVDLRLLDRLLDVGVVSAAGGSAESALNQGEAGKFDIVDTYLTGTVDGVALSEVFRKLECVDRNAVQASADQHVFGKRGHAKTYLLLGRGCAGELSAELGAGGAPAGVASGLGAVSELFTGALNKVRRGESVGGFALEVSDAKEVLVEKYFNVPVDGLTFNDFYRSFDCVDTDLAAGEIFEARRPPDSRRVEQQIKAAITCKQTLEDKVKRLPGK
jgi:hypothetical protein